VSAPLAGRLRLADAAALRGPALRTRAWRLVLAAGLVVAVVVAVLAGRHPRTTVSPYLPPGSDGVVVLDLSASISSDTYAQIGLTLDRLAGSGGRYGLVVFSGDAYEALPPGTPARELAPYARFFRVPHTPAGFAAPLPTNPWTEFFSAGTSISTGLNLARTIVRRERLRRPGLLLISDLDDDPGDLRRVAAAALALRKARIPVHIVGLDPAPSDAKLFAKLLGGDGTLSHAPPPTARRGGGSRAPLPVWLVAATLVAAALLAAGELLAPPLRFARSGA
jgi:hypothetical protein